MVVAPVTFDVVPESVGVTMLGDWFRTAREPPAFPPVVPRCCVVFEPSSTTTKNGAPLLADVPERVVVLPLRLGVLIVGDGLRTARDPPALPPVVPMICT